MSKANYLTDNQLSKIQAGVLTRVVNEPTKVGDKVTIAEDAQIGIRTFPDRETNTTREFYVFSEVTYNDKPRVNKSTSFLRSGDMQLLNDEEATIRFLNELSMLDGLAWLKKVQGTTWECIGESTRQNREGKDFKVFTWKLVA